MRVTSRPLACVRGRARDLTRSGHACARGGRYREALKLDPNHVVSLCSLAWLLRTQKRDVSSLLRPVPLLSAPRDLLIRAP